METRRGTKTGEDIGGRRKQTLKEEREKSLFMGIFKKRGKMSEQGETEKRNNLYLS